jgi:hypothetical protein
MLSPFDISQSVLEDLELLTERLEQLLEGGK